MRSTPMFANCPRESSCRSSRRLTARLSAGLLGAAAWMAGAAASAQSLPERVGRQSSDGGEARVVEVAAAVAQRNQGAATTPSRSAAGVRQATAVDQQLEERRLLAEQQLLQADRQLERLSQYNTMVPPGALQGSLVVPMTPSYSPERMAEPVQMFLPSSTFAHVQAEAELARERAVRELGVLEQSPTLQGDPAPSPERLEQVRQEYVQSQFLLRTAQIRLQQLENATQLTYSTLYPELSDLVEREILSEELRSRRLGQELEQLEPGATAPFGEFAP